MERFTFSLHHILRGARILRPSWQQYVPPCALMQFSPSRQEGRMRMLCSATSLLNTSHQHVVPSRFPQWLQRALLDFPGGQWLRLHASYTEGTSSVPSQGTKIPHARCAVRPKGKKKALLWCPVLLPWPLPPCSLYSHTCFFFLATLNGVWDLISFPTQDRTCTPCTGSSLKPWTTREMPTATHLEKPHLHTLSPLSQSASTLWSAPGWLPSTLTETALSRSPAKSILHSWILKPANYIVSLSPRLVSAPVFPASCEELCGCPVGVPPQSCPSQWMSSSPLLGSWARNPTNAQPPPFHDPQGSVHQAWSILPPALAQGLTSSLWIGKGRFASFIHVRIEG